MLSCWLRGATQYEDLNLEVAGVETDARGAIIVDEYLKTTQPNIRAVGDVKGGLQFTYISLDDYRIIREDYSERRNEKQVIVIRSVIPYLLIRLWPVLV